MADGEGIVEVKGKAVKWLADQGPITVLLFCILATIAYLGKYAIETGIPKHLEQIQTGYQEVATTMSKDNAEWRSLFREMSKLPPTKTAGVADSKDVSSK